MVKTEITVLVAQFPVTLDLRHNLEMIMSFIRRAEPDDLLVLPEGALSGYSEDPSFLTDITIPELNRALHIIQETVKEQKIHIVFGSCLKEKKSWFNCAIYYGPKNETGIYRKINLATSERGYIEAGSQLPVIEVLIDEKPVLLGIQLCREIRYPEQWKYLAGSGAELFVFLTNAIGDAGQAPVWRSHLMSRAAENQRFVISANNAQPAQKCPSMIIDPNGTIIWEMLSADIQSFRCSIDLSIISDWYLKQSREDILKIHYSK